MEDFVKMRSDSATLRFTKVWGRILLFVATSACRGTDPDKSILRRQGPVEPVLINFRSRYNVSEGHPRVYVHQQPAAASLPEVTGSRAGSGASSTSSSSVSSDSPIVIDSITTIDLSTSLPRPKDNLDAPYQDSDRDPRYYPPPFTAYKARRNPAGINFHQEFEAGSGAIKVNEMSCRNSGEELYFKASLSSLRRSDHPVIENVSNYSCKITKIKNEYYINFEKDNFWSCGVTDCSSDLGKLYCLNVRFPTISGLKLKEDATVALQCKTQDRIVSHTKQINVKTLNTAARTVPRVATGGFKNAFETDIGLYRKTYNSDNIFDTKINSGGTVVLGEEILLRASVREGDGWRHSRLSEVSVHYVERRQKNRLMNSVWLLDSDGCLNPDISEICSREQYRVSPLESYLVFEAFMFENMKDTDEMILNVKVMGCLDGVDCSINCPGGNTRKARSVGGNSTVTDWQNEIAFKVVMPKKESSYTDENYLTLLCMLCILILMIVVVVLCLVRVLLKQRVFKEQC